MLLSLVVIYYPIYSVVKNRRATYLSLSRPQAARAFLLKVQAPSLRNLNLKQTSLDKAHIRELDGGAERDRTVDPLLAKQVLSQLSYSPIATSLPDSYDQSGGPG
jgi:hypothetical protein